MELNQRSIKKRYVELGYKRGNVIVTIGTRS